MARGDPGIGEEPAGIDDTALWRKLGRDPLVPAAIYAAARHHLVRPTLDAPATAEEIAGRCEVDPAVTRRLVELLTEEGFLEREAGHRYRATPLGRRLEDPAVRTEVCFWFEIHLPYVLRLDHSLRTGAASYDAVHGEAFYRHLDARPEYSVHVRGDLARGASEAERVLSAHCDLGAVRTVVDVGGNTGSLLAALLRRWPRLTGVLVDRPEATRAGTSLLEEAGLSTRARVLPGDILSDPLPAADAYLLSWVASEWADAALVGLLRNCRRSMAPESRLWILEPVIWEEPPSKRRRDLDLLIRATVGGHLRSERDFVELFAQAGLTLRRAIRTGEYVDVVEGGPDAAGRT